MYQETKVDNKTIDKLKYDLVRDNLVTFEDLEKAQEVALSQNTNIGQILINSSLISEEKLLKFLEEKLHIPFVDLDDYEIDKKCLSFISYQEAQNYKILPLFLIEDTLSVAMADPLDLFAIDKIIERTGKNIDPIISSEKSILKKINDCYETKSKVQDINIEKNINYSWLDELHKDDLSEEHIRALFRAILKHAIIEGVHELYFESDFEGLSVYFKKPQESYSTGSIPNLLISPFIRTIKSLCGLDPNVYEIPQLGKLNFNVDNCELTSSISAFPTINGERISLKIYHPPKSLSELGISPDKINMLKESLSKPGVVLICGSSLSGKTHLIYSILSSGIIPKNKTVMSLESIAKYKLARISQCELNENIGFNLDKAMRFIEFQSPDVIYFEGISTIEGLDFFTSLTLKNKTLITEFLADNMRDLRKKFEFSEFSMFKSVISTLVFIHNKDSIEFFDKEALKRYLL